MKLTWKGYTMKKKDENKEQKENQQPSEKQIALVRLSVLCVSLAEMFSTLIGIDDDKESILLVQKINNTLDTVDNIIEEELLEIDLTYKRNWYKMTLLIQIPKEETLCH